MAHIALLTALFYGLCWFPPLRMAQTQPQTQVLGRILDLGSRAVGPPSWDAAPTRVELSIFPRHALLLLTTALVLHIRRKLPDLPLPFVEWGFQLCAQWAMDFMEDDVNLARVPIDFRYRPHHPLVPQLYRPDHPLVLQLCTLLPLP